MGEASLQRWWGDGAGRTNLPAKGAVNTRSDEGECLEKRGIKTETGEAPTLREWKEKQSQTGVARGRSENRPRQTPKLLSFQERWEGGRPE